MQRLTLENQAHLEDSAKEFVRLQAQGERGAWTRALQAVREFKKDGITVYRGTAKEISNMVQVSLETHYLGNYHNLTPDTRYVSSLRHKAELDEYVKQERQKTLNDFIQQDNAGLTEEDK